MVRGNGANPPLRPRTEQEPERAPSLPQAAESRREYTTEPSAQESPRPEEQPDGATEPASPEEASSRDDTEEPQPQSGPSDADRPAPELPNPYDAALALNACLPDGEKVERGTLLRNATRELGHEKSTRKVRRILNQALNAENNADRLKTDWEHVWKPRKK